MKKHSLFITSLLLMFTLTFTSCDSEPVDNELVNTEDPDVGTNPGSGTGTETAGSYWPMALNNEWKYTSDFAGQENVSMKITGTETIDGVAYFKYDQFIASTSMPENMSGSSTTYTRKENNDYKLKVKFNMESAPGGPSVSLSQLEYTILKDNLAVGQSWTQQVEQTMTFDMPDMPDMPEFPGMDEITNIITIKGTIMEKMETATLDNVTYNDVIKVKFEQSVLGAPGGVASYYWFVKGKGIMKAMTEELDNGEDINYKISTFTIN